MPHIRFEPTSIVDATASALVGRQQFREGILATIIIDSKSSVKYEFPAMCEHETPHQVLERSPHEIKLNFSDRLLAYLDGSTVVTGTPLEAVSAISRSQCDNLKSCGLHTVEELAEVPVPVIEHLGAAGERLRDIAKAYLEDVKGQGGNEIAQLRAENAELREQMQEILAELRKPRKEETPLGAPEPAAESNIPGFLSACCIEEEGGQVQGGKLFDAYKAWCEQVGEAQVNQNVFGAAMTNLYSKEKNSHGVFYKGIRLT